MTYANLLIRPDHGYKAYRLHARFSVDARPSPAYLAKAKMVAAEKWIADMEKQGWDYLDKHGIELRGPVPAMPAPKGLPSIAQMERIKAKDAALAVAGGARLLAKPDSWVADIPTLANSEKWDFDLAAVFVRKTLVMEYNEELVSG